MKFMSLVSTDDFSLTKFKVYSGGFVMTPTGDLRIVIQDDLGQWMTFDPKVFKSVPV